MPARFTEQIERRADLYVSTLRSYVEGLGGQLEITAVFPEGATPIRNFADLDARLSIAHQTKEAWKSRLIDAADQFLVAVGEVFQSLDLAITAQKAGADDLQAKVHEARLAYGQAARSAIRVGLLYGTDSSPEQAAQDVLDNLRACWKTLNDQLPVQQATDYLIAADTSQENFQRKANAELRRKRRLPRWGWPDELSSGDDNHD